MNQNTDLALKQAFDAIEAGNLDDARALLRPLLDTEKDNADVWWLYSHAVADPDTARLALNNVLRIDPNYPEARDLLDQLDAQQRAEEAADGIPDIKKEPDFIPPMPSSIPGIAPIAPRRETATSTSSATSDELPDDILGEGEPEPVYRRPVFYIPVIILLLLVALAIVILKPFAVNSPAPSPTSEGQTSLLATPTTETLSSGQPTAEGTAGVEVNATSESVLTIPTNPPETPTSESLGGGEITEVPTVQAEADATAETVAGGEFADISSAFTGTPLASSDPIQIVDTSLGKALTVTVCTTAGKAMRDLLPQAMDTLAKSSGNYASQAQISSVKMVDCTSNTMLLWIGAGIQDAISYANGTLADKDFQAKWQPVK